MLQLQHITREYKMGEQSVIALNDISISFDSAEFVAVLGPSGCGKTTLLNIIGGLDRYDKGDLHINGRSTKNFSDRDMDAYRNHSVGFVFQTYNLIPHQNVLANVELALTLSGVGKAERRQRAKAALESVGLGDQLVKKPNQLSGGQMQRVAIARALVNDPDVLLADEPTGALDSHTSMQVLDTLKALAKNRLVIMVTHNRKLAEKYATRIVELEDGQVRTDSAPAEGRIAESSNRIIKTSMGLKMALSLSFNNLLTKRGRTIITAFAGSIGIIGIALILAMSTGVNDYIVNIQKDTMSSYPIVIQQQTVQVGDIMGVMRQAQESGKKHPLDAVYADEQATNMMSSFRSNLSYNNLTSFKAYLGREDNPLRPYLSAVDYGYDARFDIYALDPNNELVNVSGDEMDSRSFASMLPFDLSMLTELRPASTDGLVGEAVKNRHTLLAGKWPQSAEEIVLILDNNNEISDMSLYQLGILPQEELRAITRGEAPEGLGGRSWKYEELIGKPIYLLSYSDYYVKNGQGFFKDMREDKSAVRLLAESAPVLTITGIVRANDENSISSAGIGYTSALTGRVIQRAAASAVVQAQQESPGMNVTNGLVFKPENEAEKAAEATKYVDGLSAEDKPQFALDAFRLFPDISGVDGGTSLTLPEGISRENLPALMEAFSGMLGGDTGTGGNQSGASMALLGQWGSMPEITQEALAGLGDERTANLLDAWMAAADETNLAKLYDGLFAKEAGTLEALLSVLGLVNPDHPATISLYTDTFENKEKIAGLIREYNQTVPENDRISYTDYVALMISSVTTIINVITYVLIAFVAVSLVVSSIMIGIITYISVLERTKEIGILRAVGASRKDVRRVFTSEALIIGLAAGVLGVLISGLLTFPINSIIHSLADDQAINATLPLQGALILIAISAILSLIAGWLPSRIAAKKNPVEALRSE
jgi:putative ABC transport system permease protein